MFKIKENKFYLILLIVLILFFSSSCLIAKPAIESVTLCKDVDKQKNPLNITDSFLKNDNIIYCVIKVKNASIGAKVMVKWLQLPQNISIAESTYVFEKSGQGNLAFNISRPGMTKIWPSGNYRVEIYLAAEKGKIPSLVGTKSFKIL